jgi:hypothetical protein
MIRISQAFGFFAAKNVTERIITGKHINQRWQKKKHACNAARDLSATVPSLSRFFLKDIAHSWQQYL